VIVLTQVSSGVRGAYLEGQLENHSLLGEFLLCNGFLRDSIASPAPELLGLDQLTCRCDRTLCLFLWTLKMNRIYSSSKKRTLSARRRLMRRQELLGGGGLSSAD